MRRIPGTELSAYLLMQKQQLSTLGADNVFPQVRPDKDQIKEYLENPPAGMCSVKTTCLVIEFKDPVMLIQKPVIRHHMIFLRQVCEHCRGLLTVQHILLICWMFVDCCRLALSRVILRGSS